MLGASQAHFQCKQAWVISESPRDALHESPRRVHLRARAVCGVANPRNSSDYCCGLRLAAHPDPQRTLTARFVKSIPSKLVQHRIRTVLLIHFQSWAILGGVHVET